MTQSPVSIQNFKELVKPKLKESQQEIYDIIAKHPNGINSLDLAKILNKERHKFSGRISEMVDMGIIIVDRWDKVGRSNFGVWVAVKFDEKGQAEINF